MSGMFVIGLADAPAGGASPAAPSAPPAAPPPAGAPAPTGTGTQQPAAPAAGPLGCGSQGITGMVPFILIFVVFYFLLIRPQQKKQKEQQEWLKNLRKGDEVVTNGGLIGKISGMTDSVVTLEVQEKVRVRILRSSVAGKAPGAVSSSSASPSSETK